VLSKKTLTPLDVVYQCLFDFPFAVRISSVETIQAIGILEDHGRHIRAGGRHREDEIAGGFRTSLAGPVTGIYSIHHAACL